MLNTKAMIEQAESLPVEERALLVDSLLQTFNRTDPEVDRKWAKVARRRLAELRSRRIKAIPGNKVFERARARFSK